MSNKVPILFTIVFIGVLNPIQAVTSYAGLPGRNQAASGPLDLGYKQGELLVRFAPKPDGTHRKLAECNSILASINGGTVKRLHRRVPGSALVKLPENITVEEALLVFNKATGIRYAAPNHSGRGAATFPNDTRFEDLWGMHNTGQTVCEASGTQDADIDAPDAWDIETDASDIIVAVIDSGVDYYHEDLAANMWINPGEDQEPLGVITPADWNGEDDDENGLVDDICGYDFCTRWQLRDPDPMDELGHGTHLSGTLGAVGNNGEGVVGVCWNVKIMALRWIDDDNFGWTSDAIECIDYAVNMGAKVLNNSWGIPGFNQLLRDHIEDAHEAGVLFVAAAGNRNLDNDLLPFYPASYDLDNIISVMATDYDDERSVWPWGSSNWGAVSVDLAAPGTCILSCVPPAVRGVEYEAWDGTSMATPHVAGACALIWSANPYLGHLQVKQVVLDTVDELEALECVTEGRLNLYKAMDSLYIFFVKNSLDEPVAWFDSFGNLFLEEGLTTGVDPLEEDSDHDEFRVQDSLGVDVAIIDATNGNMYITGEKHEYQDMSQLSPEGFIIKNSSGDVVAYIDDSGDEAGHLYLVGKLYENQ